MSYRTGTAKDGSASTREENANLFSGKHYIGSDPTTSIFFDIELPQLAFNSHAALFFLELQVTLRMVGEQFY